MNGLTLETIRTSCPLEYNSYLFENLSSDLQNQVDPQFLYLTSLTPRLEALYKKSMEMRESWTTGQQLEKAAASCNLIHCVIALKIDSRPSQYSLDQVAQRTLLSSFDSQDANKLIIVNALLENGAQIPMNFGSTILQQLTAGSLHAFDLGLFESIVNGTGEKFCLTHLRDFLAGDYCRSPEELVATVDFLLRNLSEPPCAHSPPDASFYFESFRQSCTSTTSDWNIEENVIQERAKTFKQWIESEKRHNQIQPLAEVIKNCFTFKNSNELLHLLHRFKLQGTSRLNAVPILNAIDLGVEVDMSLAQFFMGDAAQSTLESLIYACHRVGCPSRARLDFLIRCGGVIQDDLLVNLLEGNHPDTTLTLALSLMTTAPGEKAMNAALECQRKDIWETMTQLRSSKSSHPESL